MRKLAKWIDTAASLAIIGLCMTVAVSYIRDWRYRPSAVEPQQKLSLSRGIRLAALDRLPLTANKTVVLVLSTTCQHCRANVPFYKPLLSKTGIWRVK
jgi:hypothetical protein